MKALDDLLLYVINKEPPHIITNFPDKDGIIILEKDKHENYR